MIQSPSARIMQDEDEDIVLLRQRYRDRSWRRIRFYAQLFISLVVLIFCMVMVAVEEVGCERAVFMSTIAGIVGFWLPTPSAA